MPRPFTYGEIKPDTCSSIYVCFRMGNKDDCLNGLFQNNARYSLVGVLALLGLPFECLLIVLFFFMAFL